MNSDHHRNMTPMNTIAVVIMRTIMVLRSKVGMVTVPILIDNYHFHGHGGLAYRGTAGTAAHMIIQCAAVDNAEVREANDHS